MIVWRVDFLDSAKCELKKLDKRWQLAILDYLEDEIAGLENPRSRGKPWWAINKGSGATAWPITALHAKYTMQNYSLWQ